MPDPDKVECLLARVGWQRVDWQRPTLCMQPGMEIDFGGIGKEYAADRAATAMAAAGAVHAVVYLGGDVRVVGSRPDGSAWRVAVQDPRGRPGVTIAHMEVTQGAMATSGDYERYFDEDGKRFHHIIDPKTGDSARKCRSVTIISGTAVRTDALTKSVFIMGPEAGIEFINTLPDVDAVAVAPDGKVYYSKGLAPPG